MTSHVSPSVPLTPVPGPWTCPSCASPGSRQPLAPRFIPPPRFLQVLMARTSLPLVSLTNHFTARNLSSFCSWQRVNILLGLDLSSALLLERLVVNHREHTWWLHGVKLTAYVTALAFSCETTSQEYTWQSIPRLDASGCPTLNVLRNRSPPRQ